MTEPTPDQIQRACDMLHGEYEASSYGEPNYYELTILADTIAQMDAMQAERDKARADLGEIDALLEGQPPINSSLTDAQAIAAPYRVETDPLEYAIGDLVEKPKGYPFPGKVVSAFAVTGGQRFVVESELSPGMLHIFSASQLAKRGLEIGRSA